MRLSIRIDGQQSNTLPFDSAIRKCAVIVGTLVLAPSVGLAQSAPAKPVPANNETTTTTTRLGQRFGGSPYKEIWVQNASTTPVQVYTVTLSGCVNIREECDQADSVNVHVAPGDRKLLHRVDPCDDELKFSFRYTMEWRADTLQHK